MEIELSKRSNEVLVIQPVGDLDTFTSSEFAEKINATIDTGLQRAVLDFSKISYVSSLGIGEIIQVWDRLRNSGGAMKFACMSDTVFKVFKLVGLTTRFEIFKTLDDALASFH